jgi:hypothetical protein
MHKQVSIMTKLSVLMERLSRQQLFGETEITDADLFGV